MRIFIMCKVNNLDFAVGQIKRTRADDGFLTWSYSIYSICKDCGSETLVATYTCLDYQKEMLEMRRLLSVKFYE